MRAQVPRKVPIMATSSSQRRRASAKEDAAVAALGTVLAATKLGVSEEDADELRSLEQDVEEARREEGRRSNVAASKGSKADKGKRREARRTLDEARVSVEEQDDKVELPRGLYPEMTHELEEERNVSEAGIERLRESIDRRATVLGNGGLPEAVERQLALARSFFLENEPGTVLINNYNDEVVTIMNAAQSFVIETPPDVVPRQRVEFVDVKILRPMTEDEQPIYPNQCRRLDLSYEFSQRATLRETVGDADPTLRGGIEVARVPVMVFSNYCYLNPQEVPREELYRYGECKDSPGAGFVVNGKDIALTGQEKLSIDLSILVDRGAKYGTTAGFECSMLCMTPSKALAHHIFHEREIARKSDQVEIVARVQNLTSQSDPANVLALLRAIKIVEEGAFERVGRPAGSRARLLESMDEHIAELCAGGALSLARDFRTYLSTTLAKALNEKDDTLFLTDFAKRQALPLRPKRPPPPKAKKAGKAKARGGKRAPAALAREEEPEAEPTAEEAEEAPLQLREVWSHIMNNLFPQVTLETYMHLFLSRDEALKGKTYDEVVQDADLYEELADRAVPALQRAKEHLLLYNVFRLFLYRQSPASEMDDRDHFGIKRVELAGTLVANLYLKELQKARNRILESFREAHEKKGSSSLIEHVKRFFENKTRKVQTITSAIHTSFTSEHWGSSAKYTTTRGVSHPIETESLASNISSLRKVSSKGDQAKRTVLPHLFHASQAGIFCPFETPDDQQCGIRKFLAISSDVSREMPSDQVVEGLFPRLEAAGIRVYAPSEWGSAAEESKRGDEARGGEGLYWPLYVNGIPLGYAPERALDVVRAWRRTAGEGQMGLATLSAYVKRRVIAGFNQLELHVASTPNRMVRPLHICAPVDPTQEDSPMALMIDLESRRLRAEAGEEVDLWRARWTELLWEHSVIEYVDKREEESYSQTTAWYPWELSNAKGTRYLHCEVNPFFSFGYNAASMPFIDHQQGTRTAYGANQLKHVVGVPTSMYASRFDTTMKVLLHPQRPLTTTLAYKGARFSELPTGTNAMVAILSGKSNIEDAMILNKASTQRGLFNTMVYTTVRVMNAPGTFDAPAVPDKTVPAKPRQPAHLGTRVERTGAPKIVAGSTSHLSKAYPTPEQVEAARRLERETGAKVALPTAHPAGIVPVGTQVQTGDVLATKIRPGAPGVKEHEQTLKHTRSGRVDAIQMVGSRSGPGVKIRIAFPNVPEVGDKLASIESQKGLIGELREEVDMPYSESGEVPDILMNPHGFPSRQTYSYIMEAMFGKSRLSAPRGSTLPGSALRGAQPYNRTYKISETRDFFFRPNLTLMWMRDVNDVALQTMRLAYARLPEHVEEYSERVVDTATLSEAKLKILPKEQRKTVVEHASAVVRALLYAPGGRDGGEGGLGVARLYDDVARIPAKALEMLKGIFSKELVDELQGGEGYVEDIARSLLEEHNDKVLEIFYGEKRYRYVGDLPQETERRFDPEIRRAVLASGKGTKATLSESKVAKISLEELAESGIVGAKELVDELRSTLETGEGEQRTLSDTRRTIELLFELYMEEPNSGYEEVVTAAGVVAKRVSLSFAKRVASGEVGNDEQLIAGAERLVKRLLGRYGASYVPLVDVISLKDQSAVARSRLGRLRAQRDRTESVKERSQNATALNKTIETEEIAAFLQELGWDDGGEENLVDGTTGQEFQCRIFTGPVLYHTMTQMASDKIQSRSNTGAISAVTHRPQGGRKTVGGGGGKVEEMQTLALLSHSSIDVIGERLTEESVMMRELQCSRCGEPCVRGAGGDNQCIVCGKLGTMVMTSLPFPTRAVKARMAVMGVNMTFGGDVAQRDMHMLSRERAQEVEEEVAEDLFEDAEAAEPSGPWD
jgi:DNA-directed RNA polymerase beta subunit